MSENEISRIKVGRDSVGIIGLKLVIEELAEEYGNKSDEDVRHAMMERLGRSNYIAEGSEEDYGEAFLREFRKALGQPYVEPAPVGIDIKVLGPGCVQCDQLERTLMEILAEVNLPASVDHVTDIKDIARYGVMGTPALLINGKVMAAGSVPPRGKIKKWLQEAGPARRP